MRNEHESYDNLNQCCIEDYLDYTTRRYLMKLFQRSLILIFIAVLSSCAYFQPKEPGPACPDSSIVNLNRAVDMAIECVKFDTNKFDIAFARLISIAQQSPSINNGEIILRFISAVAIDAPFIPAKRAKMKWNRYFAPTFYVSMGYMYDSIKNYCPDRIKIKRSIDEELTQKKIGFLKCMADQTSKDEAFALYRQAEETAMSLKIGLDAACKACCSKKRLGNK